MRPEGFTTTITPKLEWNHLNTMEELLTYRTRKNTRFSDHELFLYTTELLLALEYANSLKVSHFNI